MVVMPAARPARLHSVSKPKSLPVNVARSAAPMMMKRGVDCGIDCAGDGAQAQAPKPGGVVPC